MKTSLAVQTPLTPAECKAVCASEWCGGRPIGPDPGCSLSDPQNVLCGSTATDCGYTFPSVCNASNCAGCCRDGDGSCDLSAFACGGASCSTCRADAGDCTPANCAALQACGGELEGLPRLASCVPDGGSAQSVDPWRYCPETCAAEEAGSLLGCASTIALQCADAGADARNLLTKTCAPRDGGIDAGCVDACGTVRTTCDQRCPASTTSVDSCMSCSAQCGLDWSRCARACRE
ncbi:MAG: hypothetical protein Q8L48_01405 [Archangium sp.]|nr:hypothetical protein [Archangium sp.]